MAQAGFDQFQLAMAAAKHRNFSKGAYRPMVMAKGLGLQHIDATGHAADLLSNPDRLCKRSCRFNQANGCACFAHRPQMARFAGVVVDQSQRAGKNFRGGAVILLQMNGTQLGEIGCQLRKTVGVRPTKAVDGLVRVADYEEGGSLR